MHAHAHMHAHRLTHAHACTPPMEPIAHHRHCVCPMMRPAIYNCGPVYTIAAQYIQLRPSIKDAPRLRTNAPRDCGRMCSATADVKGAATRSCTSLVCLTAEELCPVTADDTCNGLRVLDEALPRDCNLSNVRPPILRHL